MSEVANGCIPNDPELMAAQRAEQENEARMPTTPEEMIDATLEPSTGCVDHILLSLSRTGAGNLSEGETFSDRIVWTDADSLLLFLLHIEEQKQPQLHYVSRSQKDLFRGISLQREIPISSEEKDILKELAVCTIFFDPIRCADLLDPFFCNHPGAFDPFLASFSEQERKEFLNKVCSNINNVFQSSNRMIFRAAFLFLVLRACAREMPNDDEYLRLKKYFQEKGYESTSLPHRSERGHYEITKKVRIRFTEETDQWIAERCIVSEDGRQTDWVMYGSPEDQGPDVFP